MLAAFATPWPGSVPINNDATGTSIATITRNAAIGELTSSIDAGPTAVWDDATTLMVTLYSGHLASADEDAVLSGGNRLAVQNDAGEWEVVGFVNANLTAPSTYALTRLLRGQGGTVHAIGPAAAGNRVIVLDDTIIADPVTIDWLGETLALRAYAGRADPTGTSLSAIIDLPPDLPLAPVHLSAIRDPVTGNIAFAWVRCSRADTDSWTLIEAPLDYSPEAYSVTVFNGLTAVRTITASAPAAAYAAADQTADFGSPPTSFTFTVAQVSPILGPGLAAEGDFHA